MKILVVDDHPLIREALREVLKALDAQIVLVEASSCAEGLAAAHVHPDLGLVLLDLTLPDNSGFDALAQFRAEHPGVPVVMLSATDETQTVTHALDAGAMGFIPKTSSTQLLVSALRLVLSGGVYLPPEVLRHSGGAPAALYHAGSSAASAMTYREIGLTERQAQVLSLMVQGKPNKLICRDLKLAEGTVKIHVTAVLKALGVANRTQAVIAVGRLGLRLPSL
jgi:DNA-binding NarL/FixJ family response regulator